MTIAHAKLSASGSHRWLNCTGSVKAEQDYPTGGSSIFAQEGTRAHELADICLKSGKPATDYVGSTIEDGVVDVEMADYVQQYVDYVQSFKGDAFYEQRVEFTDWVAGGFGTSDAIVVEPDGKTVHVIDLKYGKGVAVDAEENTQGILYALGVYQDYKFIYDELDTFVIHIYQPRIGNFSRWSVSVPDLLNWGEWIAQQAETALTDDAPRTPGEKQCNWCAHKACCVELKQYMHDVIAADFDDLTSPDKLSKSDLVNIHTHKSMITGWLDAVDKKITTEMLDGEKYPDLKLVAGRSLRKWSNEKDAETKLVELLDQDAYNKKLLSVAQAEKALGKTRKAEINDLVIKPPGKPTIAPTSDKRPALDDVTDDFDAV